MPTILNVSAAEKLSGPRFRDFPCKKCNGTGEMKNKYASFTCVSCGGQGFLRRHLDLIEDRRQRMIAAARIAHQMRRGWY